MPRLLIEAATCLSQPSIAAIADFVRRGGLLIAAYDSGRFDEIGRPRTGSDLWSELGLSGAPVRATRCGKGRGIGRGPSGSLGGARRSPPAGPLRPGAGGRCGHLALCGPRGPALGVRLQTTACPKIFA